MKKLRYGIGILTVLLLTLGYAASQRAYFTGEPDKWAKAVDIPPVAYGATLLLVVIVVLGFLKDHEANEP